MVRPRRSSRRKEGKEEAKKKFQTQILRHYNKSKRKKFDTQNFRPKYVPTPGLLPNQCVCACVRGGSRFPYCLFYCLIYDIWYLYLIYVIKQQLSAGSCMITHHNLEWAGHGHVGAGKCANSKYSRIYGRILHICANTQICASEKSGAGPSLITT